MHGDVGDVQGLLLAAEPRPVDLVVDFLEEIQPDIAVTSSGWIFRSLSTEATRDAFMTPTKIPEVGILTSSCTPTPTYLPP